MNTNLATPWFEAAAALFAPDAGTTEDDHMDQRYATAKRAYCGQHMDDERFTRFRYGPYVQVDDVMQHHAQVCGHYFIV